MHKDAIRPFIKDEISHLSRSTAKCFEAEDTHSNHEGGRIRRGEMEVDGEPSDNIAERCGRAAAHSFNSPENANIDVNLSNSIFRPQKKKKTVSITSLGPNSDLELELRILFFVVSLFQI